MVDNSTMSIDQRLIFVTHCVYPLPQQFIKQIDQRKTSTTLLRLKGKNDALDNSLSTNHAASGKSSVGLRHSSPV